MLVAWRPSLKPSTRETAMFTSRIRSSLTTGQISCSSLPLRSPIDLLWDEPTVAGHLRRLASFSRLIMTDLLGMGSSDAVPIQDRPAMQAWTDGLVAVLDAVGIECVSLFAMTESALPVMLLAATHPQRVRSLVLWSPYARFLRADDYPYGMPEPAFSRYVEAFGDTVGTEIGR